MSEVKIRELTGTVWSYGVVVWEIVTRGGTPFADLTAVEAAIGITTKGLRLKVPPGTDASLYKLMIGETFAYMEESDEDRMLACRSG